MLEGAVPCCTTAGWPLGAWVVCGSCVCVGACANERRPALAKTARRRPTTIRTPFRKVIRTSSSIPKLPVR